MNCLYVGECLEGVTTLAACTPLKNCNRYTYQVDKIMTDEPREWSETIIKCILSLTGY